MDRQTARYYADQAKEMSERYEAAQSPLAPFFPLAFVRGGRVLDVGAGSGRDLAELCRQGYDGYGVEPIAEMRAEAVTVHPELDERITGGALPDLGLPFGGRFDGIVCSAVLMHVPESQLFDTAFALRNCLKQHGRLLVSVPLSRSDVRSDNRDAGGRLFAGYTADFLKLLFERLGFQEIGTWEMPDALNREGHAWKTLLLELRSGDVLRPVDQIEGILNRDKKVATYKLALFRALAEIATQQLHTVRWLPDGKVGVPIRAVAEKWVFYYWPIFAAERFYPQVQGERENCAKPVKFRKSLTALISDYAQQGGLTAFALDWAVGFSADGKRSKYAAVLREIEDTIRSGPVTYAGGALETGRVFEFDGLNRLIVFSGDLWRELSLLGHWIVDAVILRWAELSERLGRNAGIASSQIVELLLTRPIAQREALLSQQVYARCADKVCVWSDQVLTSRFDVDHVIPFSPWGNNHLWNLLPAHPAVNREKADRLPSAAFLRGRQDRIVSYWRILRTAAPTRFDNEATRLAGHPIMESNDWENALFARVREAVEVTALQRGVQRWEII